MIKIHLKLVTLNGLSSFEFTLMDQIIELLGNFDHEVDVKNKTFTLFKKQIFTNTMKRALRESIDNLRNENNEANGLYNALKFLNESEVFLVYIDHEHWTQESIIKSTLLLYELNGLKAPAYNEITEQYGELFRLYKMYVFFAKKKRNIGESNKKKRICRFCGKGQSEGVSFTNRAHAISEALGNRTLILYEECDECNAYFDINIERDMIKYLDFIRTLFHVKGKSKKIPTLKGMNFEFSNKDDELQLVIFNKTKENNLSENKRMVLNTYDKITPQNIYKTLVKFALSVIPKDELEAFSETLKWIRTDKMLDHLPKVALARAGGPISSEPEITIFIRKEYNDKLPYAVGELKISQLVFIFIIPTFKNVGIEDIRIDGSISIWSVFKQYGSEERLGFLDLSSAVRQENKFEFKVIKNERV